MSYDLSIFDGPPDGLEDESLLRPLDLDAAHELLRAVDGLEQEGDEVVWAREAIVAQGIFVTDHEGRLLAIDSGVVTEDEPAELRARELRELLDLFLTLADRLGARVYDHQFGRFVDRDDVDEIVAGFA
jgi:hypothetical protein